MALRSAQRWSLNITACADFAEVGLARSCWYHLPQPWSICVSGYDGYHRCNEQATVAVVHSEQRLFMYFHTPSLCFMTCHLMGISWLITVPVQEFKSHYRRRQQR